MLSGMEVTCHTHFALTQCYDAFAYNILYNDFNHITLCCQCNIVLWHPLPYPSTLSVYRIITFAANELRTSRAGTLQGISHKIK